MTLRPFMMTLALAATTTQCNFSDTRQNDDPGARAPEAGDAQTGGGDQDAYARLQADLFNATCARCHNPGRSAPGVDLTTAAPVKQNAAKALEEIEAGAMPPSGDPVDPVLIAGLRCWVERGSPRTGAADCFPAGDTSTATDSGTGTGTDSGPATGTGTGTDTATCDAHDDDDHDDDCDHNRRRRGHDEDDGATP